MPGEPLVSSQPYYWCVIALSGVCILISCITSSTIRQDCWVHVWVFNVILTMVHRTLKLWVSQLKCLCSQNASWIKNGDVCVGMYIWFVIKNIYFLWYWLNCGNIKICDKIWIKYLDEFKIFLCTAAMYTHTMWVGTHEIGWLLVLFVGLCWLTLFHYYSNRHIPMQFQLLDSYVTGVMNFLY
jgi:hypothetical protein